MKTGHVILEYYLNQRDFTGSKMDVYAQDLTTFHFYSQINGEEESFLNLLEQAFNQGKYIIHVSPYEEDVLYDNYCLDNLTLSDSPE